jgi:hypothetical protein
MLIVAIIPLPRNPDGLVYHFPLNEKVNADALGFPVVDTSTDFIPYPLF